MEINNVQVEILTFKTEDRLKIELYAYRTNVEDGKMLLLLCEGKPAQEQEFLTLVYSAIDNPTSWIDRHTVEKSNIKFN